jgi:hypothetical protein
MLQAILSSISPERLLTIAKMGVIILLLGATSYITWQIVQRDMDSERLAVAKHQLEIERLSTDRFLSELERTTLIATKAVEADKKLDIQVSAILKEHSNAKPLPPDCAIDSNGLRSLQAARDAAIATANTTTSDKSDD